VKSRQAVAPKWGNGSVECVDVRHIAASAIPTLFVCFMLGFLNPVCGLAFQGPPSQGNPQDGAVVPVSLGPDDLPEGQEEKLAAIEAAANGRDRRELQRHLQDVEAAVQAAAFDALSAENAPSAVQDLLAIVSDTNHPTRWQALWLLDHALQADQRVVLAALREALKDPDPVVSDYAQGALAARQEADALPGNIGSPETDSQLTRLAGGYAAASGGDYQALRYYLQDIDAAVQATAFDALAGHDAGAAVRDLLANIKDSTNPARCQALQLLDESAQADRATVLAALIDSLADSDPSLGDYALQALARRAEPEGMSALIQAFQNKDAVTRLTIIDAIGLTDAGVQFLREALLDSDERVRTAAQTRLKQTAEAAGRTDQQ